MEKVLLIVFAFLMTITSYTQQTAHVARVTLSVLSIGNEYYNPRSPFTSYPGFGASADSFLNCFKKQSIMPGIAKSRPEKMLTRTALNDLCWNFVNFVQEQTGDTNIGLIYYCGHGVSNLAGKMYWIPSDLTVSIGDTTFDFLAEKLFSVDSLIKHIVMAQLAGKNNSAFYIIADCCSDKAPSKWYKGITYQFLKGTFDAPGQPTEIIVDYNLDSLRKRKGLKTSLDASAALQFDDIPSAKKDTMAPVSIGLGEIPDISAIIRQQTFSRFGNRLYYSSSPGIETDPVLPPGKNNGYKIGPLCRRTLLVFKNRFANLSFDAYFKRLQDASFDKLTEPAQLNIVR